MRTRVPLGRGGDIDFAPSFSPYSYILFILFITHKTLPEGKDAECKNMIGFLLPPKENF